MARTNTRSAERIAERAESRRVYRRQQPERSNKRRNGERVLNNDTRTKVAPTKDIRTLQPASPLATRPALVLDNPVFKKKEDREREGQLYCDLSPHSIYAACTNNIQLISGHLVFAPRIDVERNRVVGSTLLVSIVGDRTASTSTQNPRSLRGFKKDSENNSVNNSKSVNKKNDYLPTRSTVHIGEEVMLDATGADYAIHASWITDENYPRHTIYHANPHISYYLRHGHTPGSPHQALHRHRQTGCSCCCMKLVHQTQLAMTTTLQLESSRISHFKKGLHDRELRSLVTKESAAKTLQATVQRIKACQRQLKSDERMKKEEQTQQEKETLDEYAALTLAAKPIPAELEQKVTAITKQKKVAVRQVNIAQSAPEVIPRQHLYPPQQYAQPQQQYTTQPYGQFNRYPTTPPPRPQSQSPWGQPPRRQPTPQALSSSSSISSSTNSSNINSSNINSRGQSSISRENSQNFSYGNNSGNLNRQGSQNFNNSMSRQSSFNNRRDPGATSEDFPQFYHDALAVTQQKFPDRTIDPTCSMIPLINGQVIYKHNGGI
ncbi:hypothetical protein TI39_contig5885g00001 [Zymoseptoria brevis]|uniref:Uncharacterized protein n=1 Tax=Zymoseptoria brevis TaxID=1047168 RepID=A0A0F4G4L4_9PEZI|nr:hypothetical protein TI39_contig5885g00001 [Zymoseptoria brevis]